MPAKVISPLVLNDLGSFGLNSQASPSALDPQWLSKAENVILDEQGRISTRKGFQQVTTTLSAGEEVQSIFEYYASDGSSEIIVGTDSDIYIVDQTTSPYHLGAQTRTGTPQTITSGHWQWVNFNEKLYGVQNGHTPVYYSGSAWTDLVDLGSYNAPSGITTFDPNCVLGEYGRLWVGGITENNNVIYYSDTLQGNKWNTGAAGQLDLKTVWGGDSIQGLAAFQGKLVIFGEYNIAIYQNPWDPSDAAFQLEELIEGVGLKARDSVAHMGNDLVFLSNTGLTSLSRTVLQNGSLPITNYSKNIRDELALNIITADMVQCKAAYCLCGGFYLLSFPDKNEAYYFDFTIKNPDGTPRISKFLFSSGEAPHALLSTVDGSLWAGRNNNGNVSLFRNYYDTFKTDVTSTSITYNDSLEITLDLSTSTAGSPAAYDATEAEAYCETQLGGSYDTGTKLCTLTVDMNDTAPTPDTGIVDPTFTWSGAGTDYCTLGGFTYSGGSCTVPLNTEETCQVAGGYEWETTDSKCWETTNQSYVSSFKSVWFDFQQPALAKILKRFFMVVDGGRNMDVVFTTYRDYSTIGDRKSFTLSQAGAPALFGAPTSLFGSSIFAVGEKPIEYKLPMAKSAKEIQIEMTGTVNGYKASLQNMTILAKAGKIR